VDKCIHATYPQKNPKMKLRQILLFICLAVLLTNIEARRRRRPQYKRNVSLRKAKVALAECQKTCNAKRGRCGRKKPPPKAACKEKSVDIILILDGSSSVGHKNFTKVKEFMSEIVSSFTIKSGGVRVALHQYSSKHKQVTEFGLREQSKQQLLDNIAGITWITGDTYTAEALNTVRTKIIEPAYKQDPNRSRMILVITDGDPQDVKQVPAAVDALKVFDAKIFAIGVGDATVTELKRLAWTGEKSDQKEYFYADDYEQAKKFRKKLVQQICE